MLIDGLSMVHPAAGVVSELSPFVTVCNAGKQLILMIYFGFRAACPGAEKKRRCPGVLAGLYRFAGDRREQSRETNRP
jgi:hypothetical protein